MKNNKICEKNGIWIDIFLLLGIIISFGMIVYTNLFQYSYNMNSDIAAEGLLARVIWESQEWIPKVWYPSTELRIFGTPNLAATIYGYVQSMSLAMGIACVVMTVGIVISAFFFTAQCGFDRRSRLLFILLCLILPNHFVTLELMYLWAGYYSVHIIVFFITLGVYVRLMKKEVLCQIDFVWILLSIVLSFFMGLQGTRSILILDGPLFTVEVMKLGYDLIKYKKVQKKSEITALMALLMLIAGFCGTQSGYSIGQEFSRNIRKGFVKLYQVVIPDAMHCIGIGTDNITIKIILLLGIVLVVAELILIIKKVLISGEVETCDWIMLLMVISPVMTMIFIAFTTINSSERYYFILLYAICFAMMKWHQNIHDRIIILGKYGIIAVLFFCIIITVYIPIMNGDKERTDERYKVIDYINECDCSFAYATFENANALTGLSDGCVNIAAVADVKDMSACKWLSRKDWYVPYASYKEKTAYIVTESEMELFNVFLEEYSDEIKYGEHIGKYYIYLSNYNFSKSN